MLADISELSKATSNAHNALLNLAEAMTLLERAVTLFAPRNESDGTLLNSDWTPIIKMMSLHSQLSSFIALEVRNALEVPTIKIIDEIKAEAEVNRRQCQVELTALQANLKKSENQFKKIQKAKDKNLSAYQNATTELNSIASEIQSVQARPMVIANAQANLNLPNILNASLILSKEVQQIYTKIHTELKALKLKEPKIQSEDLKSKK
ncbi:hypothetical protein HMI54_005103 [Coelomomyces lativittatus]|nr:hypothetical protein HMI54_005103 [Coelomomyces lativittatus]KAJ1508020.1 hypothetical protein HMI55_000551 [Coelomomyces lativittatus]KAJ1515954.1 hypothetical protein HMI56_003921 [Coelomomyces lativittatus]